MGTTDSIFISVKKLLGESESDPGFDSDIIDFINAQFLRLYHLGVGTDPNFTISGPETTWDDFSKDKSLQSSARTYIFLKVKRQFDPSGSTAVDAAYVDNIHELEFTMNLQYEGGASGE